MTNDDNLSLDAKEEFLAQGVVNHARQLLKDSPVMCFSSSGSNSVDYTRDDLREIQAMPILVNHFAQRCYKPASMVVVHGRCKTWNRRATH